MRKFIFAAATLALMSSAASADLFVDNFKLELSAACGKIETLESGDLVDLMALAARINRTDGLLRNSRNMNPGTLMTIAKSVGLTSSVSVLFQTVDGKELPSRKLMVRIVNYIGKDYRIACESGRIAEGQDRWFQ